jgi:DNA-binding transcriptional LysR family regulator
MSEILDALKTFFIVARSGSFTKAAGQMGVASSCLVSRSKI